MLQQLAASVCLGKLETRGSSVAESLRVQFLLFQNQTNPKLMAQEAP